MTAHYVDEPLSQRKERWFLHAQERAMERYGIVYDKQTQDTIIKDYHHQVFNTLLKIPKTCRLVLRGRVQDVVATFVYDTRHDVVVTFLQNKWVKQDPIDPEEMYISKNKSKLKVKKKSKHSLKFTRKKNSHKEYKRTKCKREGLNDIDENELGL